MSLYSTPRRALLTATYLAVACRLLVPLGYMPAALGQGSPIRLCWSGLPAGLLTHEAAHGGHHGEQHDEAWDRCPLGVLAGHAAPPASFALPIDRLAERHARLWSVDGSAATTVPTIRSRGPPQPALA